MAEASKRLTKRVVDAVAPSTSRYILWDSDLKGIGIRVETSGTKTYLVRYRPKSGGAKAPKRFVTIGRHGVLTPEQARERAKEILGAVANGADPAGDRKAARVGPTIASLFKDYMRLHVGPKLNPATAKMYRSAFGLYVLPEWGDRRPADLNKADLLKLHARLSGNRATANRVLNYLSAMYGWAGKHGFVPKDLNPASGVERYAAGKRERYVSAAELDRLGNAIREAETIGIPWDVDEDAPKAKHAPKHDRRQTPISPQAAAALRPLLFTGARLREILHLKWEWVDFERGTLFLPDSKTGRKTIYLNGPALAVLESLPRISPYVFPGEPGRKMRSGSGAGERDKPRWDLKRPWRGIQRMAGLTDVRLHDLRHTHASLGVGGGLGLPVIAKLLGHTQIRTTERYSHLDADPIRRASESIAQHIAAAMGEGDPVTEDDRTVASMNRGRNG